MDRNLIEKTEAFLKAAFADSGEHYRLEHSYRVANIARHIARSEGLDETLTVIAALLHDLSYSEGIADAEAWKNHGRRSAALARPFLMELGLSEQAINEIAYAIAIHVDDEADFDWPRSAFSETVGDADNIDRFDAYRIYETLQSQHFSELALDEKREKTAAMLQRLRELRDMRLGTAAAAEIWRQRLDDYIAFYEKLRAQLDASSAVL